MRHTSVATLVRSHLNPHINYVSKPQTKQPYLSSSSKKRFSTVGSLRLRNSELNNDLLTSLRANPSRLWSDIHTTAQWGANNTYGSGPHETGLSRLTLSAHDKSARDWFVSTTQSLSCKIYADAIGNLFAIRPGLRDDVPATFAGSHLDSQPMGGRFDGVLGVCAGIEMLRTLDENHIETEGPVGVVNWTNEEGARFPVSMMGSGVWSGAQDLERMKALRDVTVSTSHGEQARTVEEELVGLGYRDVVPASWRDGVRLGGYFELHIEQGPYLVGSGEKIGVVEGVQAYKWFEIIVNGRACHTGTTGFQDRADALYWASKIITKVRDVAEDVGGLASVGIIKSEPQSVNTVPERVLFTLDMRHRSDDVLEGMVQSVRRYLGDLQSEVEAKGSVPVMFDMKETFASPSTQFNAAAIDCVESSAKALVGSKRRKMHSGAGHDAVNTNMRCPTAMVFVPCRDGVSHHPREWSEDEDCELGASVLLQSVLRFDKMRYEKGDYE